MTKILCALLLCLASCQTTEALKNPSPATDGDYVAFDALIEHGVMLLSQGGDALEEDWVEDVATAYMIARSVAGNPIYPQPGETPEEAAFREAIAELMAGVAEGADIVADESWVRSLVRIYSAWRITSGDPIPAPSK